MRRRQDGARGEVNLAAVQCDRCRVDGNGPPEPIRGDGQSAASGSGSVGSARWQQVGGRPRRVGGPRVVRQQRAVRGQRQRENAGSAWQRPLPGLSACRVNDGEVGREAAMGRETGRCRGAASRGVCERRAVPADRHVGQQIADAPNRVRRKRSGPSSLSEPELVEPGPADPRAVDFRHEVTAVASRDAREISVMRGSRDGGDSGARDCVEDSQRLRPLAVHTRHGGEGHRKPGGRRGWRLAAAWARSGNEPGHDQGGQDGDGGDCRRRAIGMIRRRGHRPDERTPREPVSETVSPCSASGRIEPGSTVSVAAR